MTSFIFSPFTKMAFSEEDKQLNTLLNS